MSSYDMHVQVVDLLTPVFLAVHDETVPSVRYPLGFGHLRRNRHHSPEGGLVRLLDISGRGDQAVRHYQKVRGSLGINISERGHQIVLVQNIRRDLAPDDLQKQTVLRHGFSGLGWAYEGESKDGGVTSEQESPPPDPGVEGGGAYATLVSGPPDPRLERDHFRHRSSRSQLRCRPKP